MARFEIPISKIKKMDKAPEGEFRHVVTYPIVTDDVTGETDLGYTIHHSTCHRMAEHQRRREAREGGVNPVHYRRL